MPSPDAYVLPGLAGVDDGRLDAHLRQAMQDGVAYELGVNSSTTVRHLSCWPLAQESNTKS